VLSAYVEVEHAIGRDCDAFDIEGLRCRRRRGY
jgi:hypothetical protein